MEHSVRYKLERRLFPHNQPVALRAAVPRTSDRDRSADEAVHDLIGAFNDRIPDDDRRLDVRADEPRAVSDRRVRTDISARTNHAITADDHGAFHHTSRRDDRPFPDSHASFDGRALFDRPVNPPLDVVEEEVVRLQDVLRLPGVFPPALHDGGPDPPALFPQLVERLRDLELVSPRWLLPLDDGEDVLPEQVDSDES